MAPDLMSSTSIGVKDYIASLKCFDIHGKAFSTPCAPTSGGPDPAGDSRDYVRDSCPLQGFERNVVDGFEMGVIRNQYKRMLQGNCRYPDIVLRNGLPLFL